MSFLDKMSGEMKGDLNNASVLSRDAVRDDGWCAYRVECSRMQCVLEAFKRTMKGKSIIVLKICI